MFLLRNSGSEMMGILLCEMIILIPVMIFMMVCMWKLFEKAGHEGWKALIPIYNAYVLTVDIAGKDTTTFILRFIPIINIYAAIVTYMALAKSFGKDEGFGIGLFLLGIVFFPWLAFAKDIKYVGPNGVATNPDSSSSLNTNWQNNNPQGPPQS
jgi:hypothetical protein